MSINLPVPIAAYFSASQTDGDAVARCFNEQAVVKDEGHTYTGRAAIKGWKTETSTKYTYTCEPFTVEDNGGRTLVCCHVVGDFPGSPIDLRHAFILEGDKIAILEITL